MELGMWNICREVCFSACFSRGIRDDIEEEDDQVSSYADFYLLCLPHKVYTGDKLELAFTEMAIPDTQQGMSFDLLLFYMCDQLVIQRLTWLSSMLKMELLINYDIKNKYELYSA